MDHVGGIGGRKLPRPHAVGQQIRAIHRRRETCRPGRRAGVAVHLVIRGQNHQPPGIVAGCGQRGHHLRRADVLGKNPRVGDFSGQGADIDALGPHATGVAVNLAVEIDQGIRLGGRSCRQRGNPFHRGNAVFHHERLQRVCPRPKIGRADKGGGGQALHPRGPIGAASVHDRAQAGGVQRGGHQPARNRLAALGRVGKGAFFHHLAGGHQRHLPVDGGHIVQPVTIPFQPDCRAFAPAAGDGHGRCGEPVQHQGGGRGFDRDAGHPRQLVGRAPIVIFGVLFADRQRHAPVNDRL